MLQNGVKIIDAQERLKKLENGTNEYNKVIAEIGQLLPASIVKVNELGKATEVNNDVLNAYLKLVNRTVAQAQALLDKNIEENEQKRKELLKELVIQRQKEGQDLLIQMQKEEQESKKP